jgi:hypothetical protein
MNTTCLMGQVVRTAEGWRSGGADRQELPRRTRQASVSRMPQLRRRLRKSLHTGLSTAVICAGADLIPFGPSSIDTAPSASHTNCPRQSAASVGPVTFVVRLRSHGALRPLRADGPENGVEGLSVRCPREGVWVQRRMQHKSVTARIFVIPRTGEGHSRPHRNLRAPYGRLMWKSGGGGLQSSASDRRSRASSGSSETSPIRLSSSARFSCRSYSSSSPVL